MLGILFFIFASCHPLMLQNGCHWRMLISYLSHYACQRPVCKQTWKTGHQTSSFFHILTFSLLVSALFQVCRHSYIKTWGKKWSPGLVGLHFSHWRWCSEMLQGIAETILFCSLHVIVNTAPNFHVWILISVWSLLTCQRQFQTNPHLWTFKGIASILICSLM